jgi:hypothetical protein
MLFLVIACCLAQAASAETAKPQGMVWISSGEFLDGQRASGQSFERTARRATSVDGLWLVPAARRGTPPDTGMSHIGFRCALSEAPREQTTDKAN